MKTELYKLTYIRAIRWFLIVIPVLAIYLQENGLSVRDIFVIQVIFSIAIVVLEVPSGYLADQIGRKVSIIIGTILGALGSFAYYVADGFWEFAVVQIILALGASFLSGADSAFLYDTLQEHGVVDRYKRYEGKMQALDRIVEAIASLSAGILLLYMSIQGLFYWQFVVLATAIPIAFMLREPKCHKPSEKLGLYGIIKFALKENPRLRYLNLYSGFVNAATLAMTWFAQPYMKEVGVPIMFFGVIWAGLNILVAVGAYMTHILEKFVTFRAEFGILAFAPLVLFGLMALDSTWLGLLVIPLFWVLRGVHTPAVLDYVNQQVDSPIRATVLSLKNLTSRLIFSIFSPFLGWMVDIWSFQVAFAASAVVFGFSTIFMFILLYGVMKPGVMKTPNGERI